MALLHLDNPNGGMIIDREVVIQIAVPVSGSASNGAVLDHVHHLLTNALDAADVWYRTDSAIVKRTS
jgi:hypothetical protein